MRTSVHLPSLLARRIGGALAVTVSLSALPLTAGTAVAAPPPTTSWTDPDLGPLVTVFGPDTPVAEIQAALDRTWAVQKDNEMGSERYAYLFEPGTYGTAGEPLQAKVG